MGFYTFTHSLVGGRSPIIGNHGVRSVALSLLYPPQVQEELEVLLTRAFATSSQAQSKCVFLQQVFCISVQI